MRRAAAALAVAVILLLAAIGLFRTVVARGLALQVGPGQQRAQAPQPAAEEILRTTPSSNPGGQESRPNVSLALTLRSARIVRADPKDGEEEVVQFTFAGAIQDVADGRGFHLIGPHPADQAISERAALLESDPKSVLVGFRSGTDARSFTLGAAASGAVRDRDGKANVSHAVALSASAGWRGPTAGPDLLWVSLDRSRGRIAYVFDEHLDEAAQLAPDHFGYHTRGGRMHLGRTVVSVEKQVVTVQFDRSHGDHVEDAVRFFVTADTVKDLQGRPSPPRAVGRKTTISDLTSVRRYADTIVDYIFDAPVVLASPREFSVYTASGTGYAGGAFARPDRFTVRVVFPQLRYVGTEVVLAAVSHGAVTSAEGASPNTAGAMQLAQDSPRGATHGPDLASAEMDDATGLVTFTFDEPLARNLSLEEIDPKRFVIFSALGEPAEGVAASAIAESWISVAFHEDEVERAQAASVGADAVRDDEGNGNPIGTAFR